MKGGQRRSTRDNVLVMETDKQVLNSSKSSSSASTAWGSERETCQ